MEESQEIPHGAIKFGEKIWNSPVIASAGFFTKNSRPQALMDLYENCDAIPNFDIVQGYRTDDKECKSLYSNPRWFFQIWKDQILAAHEKEKKERKKNKRKKNKVEKRRLCHCVCPLHERFRWPGGCYHQITC